MEYSRLEYWSGWPYPSPGDLPNPGIKLRSPALEADSLPSEPQGSPKKMNIYIYIYIYIYIVLDLCHYRLLQYIEYSSLCYTVDLYCLSFIYNSVYLQIQAPNLSPLFPFHNHKFVFSVCKPYFCFVNNPLVSFLFRFLI